MHIVHIATELAPIAKVGGLADVVYSLSKETVKQGHHVDIIIPKYDCIDYAQVQNLQVEMRDITLFEGPYPHSNTLWSAKVDGLNVFFIEPHHPQHFFSRGKVYGEPDDIDRFLYFTRAAFEYLLKSKKPAEVIHLHDWPTAIGATLFHDMYKRLGLKSKGVVLTIHNLEYQGRCVPSHLSRIGLRGGDYLSQDKMQDPHDPKLINLLKGGIVKADFLTVVSPNYEEEIKTVEGGCGLHEVLCQNEGKLKGILNGIDPDFWDPSKDPLIPVHFSEKNWKKGKAENRAHLQREFDMPQKKAPLVGCVTRLVRQKAPDLIEYAIKRVLEKGGQFILLGTAPVPEIEKQFHDLAESLSDNKNALFIFNRNEAISHQIYAASDLFLMPSLSEPCGLSQMIALRYGTIPLVRRTGGIANTIFDWDTGTCPQNERNGFSFDFPDHAGVDWVLDRAFNTFKEPKVWNQIVAQAMQCDYSWKKTAPEYFKIYELINREGVRLREREKEFHP